MKILILNGSPKKERSATLKATLAFVEGIKKENDEVELINLSDLSIKPCMGCLSCWGKTAGSCVIKDDDIFKMKEKINSCDIFIESFPLYFFQMPGMMKVFTDRLMMMMNTYVGQDAPTDGKSFHGFRDDHTNRKFVIVSSCAYSETDKVYESLRIQYDAICGKGNYLLIEVPQLKTLLDLNNESKTNRYLNKFKIAGNKYINNELTNDDIINLRKPPFLKEAYKVFLKAFWDQNK